MTAPTTPRPVTWPEIEGRPAMYYGIGGTVTTVNHERVELRGAGGRALATVDPTEAQPFVTCGEIVILRTDN